jgi:uncharacterized protein (DUF433 family)
MEKINNRIVVDPAIMLGKPTIKGTRITVELILKTLSEGGSFTDVVDMYPHLTREDINAALLYALALVAHEETLVVN